MKDTLKLNTRKGNEKADALANMAAGRDEKQMGRKRRREHFLYSIQYTVRFQLNDMQTLEDKQVRRSFKRKEGNWMAAPANPDAG